MNIKDMSEVVEIESRNFMVNKRFSLGPDEEPSGMGFDMEQHRIFSGCGNKLMTILDTESGKVIATVPIGEGCDAGLDSKTGRTFNSNGKGALTVVRESSSCKFEVAEIVTTQRGTRTMTIDPRTYNIYLHTAQFAPPPAQIPEGTRRRPTMNKNTFVILVVRK